MTLAEWLTKPFIVTGAANGAYLPASSREEEKIKPTRLDPLMLHCVT
jgi:hypothetical protein